MRTRDDLKACATSPRNFGNRGCAQDHGKEPEAPRLYSAAKIARNFPVDSLGVGLLRRRPHRASASNGRHPRRKYASGLRKSVTRSFLHPCRAPAGGSVFSPAVVMVRRSSWEVAHASTSLDRRFPIAIRIHEVDRRCPVNWAKVPLDFFRRPAFSALPLPCIPQMLHLAATLWCRENLTDGKIPKARIRWLAPWDSGAPGDVAAELVALGLWREGREFFELLDFLDWQTSAAAAQRASDAGRRAGKASGAQRSAKRSVERNDGRDVQRTVEQNAERIVAPGTSDWNHEDFGTSDAEQGTSNAPLNGRLNGSPNRVESKRETKRERERERARAGAREAPPPPPSSNPDPETHPDAPPAEPSEPAGTEGALDVVCREYGAAARAPCDREAARPIVAELVRRHGVGLVVDRAVTLWRERQPPWLWGGNSIPTSRDFATHFEKIPRPSGAVVRDGTASTPPAGPERCREVDPRHVERLRRIFAPGDLAMRDGAWLVRGHPDLAPDDPCLIEACAAAKIAAEEARARNVLVEDSE